MFFGPKASAPEPYASAALWVMYRVVLEVRNNCRAMSMEQLSDIGEAVHNIPISLTEYGNPLDEQRIREYLAVYDAKWARTEDDLSLITSLDSAVERVQHWIKTI